MIVAHFSGRGAASVDLPTWTVAYVVLAVLVVVALWARASFVGRAIDEPVPVADPFAASEASRASGADRPEGRRSSPVVRAVTTVVRVAAAVVFVVLVVVAFAGQPTIGANIAPIAVMGVWWTLGGWVSTIGGRAWKAVDPFGLLERVARHDRTVAPPAWLAPTVFAAFVVVWTAWPEGDDPRNLGWWLTGYAVTQVVVAWLAGARWLAHVAVLPRVLDFAAWIVPVARRGSVDGDHRAARPVAWCAIVVVGAVAADRMTVAEWYLDAFADGSQITLTLVNLWLVVAATVVIGGLWWAVLVPARRHRAGAFATDDGRSIGVTALATLAAGVLLGSGLVTGLVQTQNLIVLASDPFSQGWNLFGTIYWEVSQDPVSPRVAGLIQVAAIAGSHAAAIVHLVRSVTQVVPEPITQARARLGAFTATLPALGFVGVSGVVWTLLLLGG